jgi:hypothetical protein
LALASLNELGGLSAPLFVSIVGTAGATSQHAAINHNRLPGHERPGGGAQEYRGTRDFIGLPNAL